MDLIRYGKGGEYMTRWFCLSWSPRHGEATYTQTFDTLPEAERFLRLLGPVKYSQIWERSTP